MEGCLAPSVFATANDNEDVQYFTEQYKAKTDGKNPSSLDAQAYDSMGILLTAIAENNGELNKEAIRQSVADISYEGVAGHIEFSDIGDASKQFKTMVVQDGQWGYFDN